MTYHQVLVSTDLGGAGSIALRLADELRRRAQPTRVWVPGEGAAAAEARRLGLAACRYDAGLISGDRSRWKGAIANLALARSLRREGAGIVHVHSPIAYRRMLPSLVLAGMCRLVHVHLEMRAEGLRWAFRRPPELIVTCARYLVESVRRALPHSVQDRQWIEAVPNAVDSQRFRCGDKEAAKRQVGAPSATPLALMLANLSPHKGHETAIQAVAILKQAGVPLHCWLAGVERGGATTYTERLTTLIAELGVSDRVRLLGQRDDPDLLLRAADFFLLPSAREGLPLSILEAQATKVPVLAAPTAGIPEVVVDGETGFLIAAGDAPGYAHRIRALLENAELYHRVAEQARAKTTRERSWESHCERIIELYRELFDRSRQRWRRGRLRELPRSAAFK
jgi:glycosyltransferase involved in cell wall biosynthesis